MAAPWHEHGFRFLRYEPSPLEREWFELVNATRPLGCGVWHPDSVLAARVSANVTALAEMTPSQMVYADGHGREHTVGIEPLVSSLRHPRLLTPGSHTRSALMDKTHLRIPSSDDLERLGRRGARGIFVDLGAGLFASGAPGSDNGGSLGWIPQRFGEQGVHFERIFAWEARGYSARTLWQTIPPEMVPTLSYYNVPCEVAPNSSHNPWRVLGAVATKQDYVVVKIDVDHQATELALVEQLLSGSSPASELVDEIFWEHHVAGSVVACPTLWNQPHGMGWEKMRFNKSDERETLFGSYSLFSTLRARGIRAHSWV